MVEAVQTVEEEGGGSADCGGGRWRRRFPQSRISRCIDVHGFDAAMISRCIDIHGFDAASK